ncbi:unnamed protein product [Pseudo-nitzschia multistriata]|uniref:MIOS-like alpha-solenoid domain-containing protein n=1 Tax=Pseudo-nitzschia multistriata TaxID=183589 RepID=A0A448ZIS8_9STRA|nr:unnamed protein product [Pseudo-nitzschia multistriata]
MSDHIRHRNVDVDPDPKEQPSGMDNSTSQLRIPKAPYPPMNMQSSVPSKSSLSPSPHYSTTYARASSSTSLLGERVTTTTTAPESGLLGDSASNTFLGGTTNAASVDDGNGGFSSGSKHYNKNNNAGVNNSSNNGNNSSAAAANPSQLMFYPGQHDIVASINCISSLSKNNDEPGMHGHDNRNNNPRGKNARSSISNTIGPRLLELRCLELATHQEEDDNDENKNIRKDSKETLDSRSSFFTTRTVAVSRGKPNLGTTSVGSTCMDLPSLGVVKNYDSNGATFMAVTGLSTGALCLHKFHEIEPAALLDGSNNLNPDAMDIKPSVGSNSEEDMVYASSIDYFHPRHHRKATSVAWRPTIHTNHVAIGTAGSSAIAQNKPIPGQLHRPTGPISMRSRASDREYCCFIWDILDSKKTMPLSKFAHNSPVASLAWMMDGQTLAVGGQQRTIQLYDLRLSTTNNSKLPPLSAYAHESGVHGIEVHPQRPHLMATFCRSVGEPVKLFDIRRMDSAVGEIKLTSSGGQNTSSSTASMPTSISSQRMQQAKAEAIQWNVLEPGMLSIATGESVQEYDTNSGSRPSLVRVNRVRKGGKTIKAIALYRGKEETASDGHVASVDSTVGRKTNVGDSDRLLSRLYPRRMVAVLEDQTIEDMARDANAPLAISPRDGRLFHALGPHLFMRSPSEGPSAMERIIERAEMKKVYEEEDISATMMRRARCVQANPYSMNPERNIKLMSRETLNEEAVDHEEASEPSGPALPKYRNRALLRLWGWIERVESLSFQEVDDAESELRLTKEISNAGVLQLLTSQESNANERVGDEQTVFSELLSCNIYDSAARRAALSSCGWAGKFDLNIVMAECEALGEYERSAALAVWHEDVGAAVDALQRATEAVHQQAQGGETSFSFPVSTQYAETLGLISMCIAGFGGKTESQRSVWRRACANLLQRDDLSSTRSKHSTRVAYLRALCEFLLNAGTIESLLRVLENTHLSLCDRVAFACRFLEKRELTAYLLRCVEICQELGDVEGLSITGLSKPGIKILQSFVDRYTDVQTAALVVSRVILPMDWATERKICFEWVESYRNLLNLLAMEEQAIRDACRTHEYDKVQDLQILIYCHAFLHNWKPDAITVRHHFPSRGKKVPQINGYRRCNLCSIVVPSAESPSRDVRFACFQWEVSTLIWN